MINTYTSTDNCRALTIRMVKLLKAGHYNTESYWYLVSKRDSYLKRILTVTELQAF
jgi:hypothetical protein